MNYPDWSQQTTYSKATIKTLKKVWNIFKVNKKTAPKWRQWRRSSVFIVNFEHISHLFLLKKTPFTYKLFRSLFIKQTGPSQIIKWMNPEEHND